MESQLTELANKIYELITDYKHGGADSLGEVGGKEVRSISLTTNDNIIIELENQKELTITIS